jgi:DNA-binding Lrp family transcriptional regulator
MDPVTELRLDDLEEIDRELLNAVQWDFPLDAQPYAVLSERLGIPEDEVMTRLGRVKELGVLRQLSAIFDTRALGYSSSLVAAKVDADRIDEAADVISRHPGVSHNYKRNHPYNLWYTIAVPPGDDLQAHVDVLHRESGAHITRVLPTLKLYKIGVKLDMTGQTAADAKTEVLEHERPERRAVMEAPDLSPLEIEAIRIVQEDLPLVERPFAVEADAIGTDEATLLEMLQSFKDRKLMRRFAALMNHCYKRPTYEDWPYSVFTMVHGHNARDCEDTIAAIQADTGVEEYALLWSVKEYKKTRVRYFTGDWDDWRTRHLAPAG